MKPKRFFALFFSSAAFIAAFALWNAPSAKAACCRCKIPETSGEVCIIKEAIDCDKLYTAGNPDLKSAECELESNQASCKKVADGGVCKSDPINVLAFKLPAKATTAAANTATDFDPAIPSLNISIPGLSFTPAYVSNGKVIVPYLAQYIIAFQKLLMGLGMLAAALMIIYGGFTYILGGLGISTKSRSGKSDTAGTAGKEHIIDALVGVAIIAGSYLILANLNPSTVKMDALNLSLVKLVPYDQISASQYQAAAGELGVNPVLPPPAEVLQKTKEQAKSQGIDPCLAWALMTSENGGKMIIGHDENWFVGGDTAIPQSRVDFLRSRKFYSGKDFPEDFPSMPGNCNAATRNECNRVAGARVSGGDILKNDDAPQFDKPPDFGLDWRFSHAIGAGTTITKDAKRCSNGWRGFTVAGKCFTAPQLATMEGSIDAMFALIKFFQKNGATDAMSVFKGWAGCEDKPTAKIPCTLVQKLLNIKMNYYNKCLNEGNKKI